MIDCLIIGFNDVKLENYINLVRAMGEDSGAYRDLNLYFLQHEGEYYHSMSLLNRFSSGSRTNGKNLHNADFLWPVVLYLGSYLAKRGFTFDYVNLFHLEEEKLKSKICQNNIRTIAITTTLYVTPYPILEIISFIRKYNDTAKIIVGGPYISNQTKMLDRKTLESLLSYIDADVYIDSPEGELALANTLTALKARSPLSSVDNIIYKDGNHYAFTQISIEYNPLEENMIDYSLFPREDFGEFVSLRTAKSCPFSCAFCSFPTRAGKYAYNSVELVEKELNAIKEIGSITTLTFLDDTFNVPKGRFKQVLRMMIRNQYGFKWNSFYRSDHGDEETIELMRDAGCEGVFLGMESGCDAQLERMNKTARTKHYRKTIAMLRDAGIVSHANLIFGFPGETEETAQETFEFIEEVQPDFVRAQLWYCDPITPIWDQREKYAITGSAFSWSHSTMDANRAAELVDTMFLRIKNSVWLPQNGFELWSIFYLQRQGMALDQIKAYLRFFNAGVGEKLTSSNYKRISSPVLEGLKKSSKF